MYLTTSLQQLVQSTTHWPGVLITSCNILSGTASFIHLNEKNIKLLVLLIVDILYSDQ